MLSLTVYFEDPFWVGVFEKQEAERLCAAKVTFGAEPRDFEVYELVVKHYYSLRFSPAVENAAVTAAVNPKKQQRLIHKEVSARGIGTKSQEALKLLQEQNKLERKTRSREEKEAEAERKFALRQQKKKQKHKGR